MELDYILTGKFGEEIKKADDRKAKFILDNGEQAWLDHIDELKRIELEEAEKIRRTELSMLRLERSGLKDSVQRFKFKNFIAKEDYQKSMINTCQKFIGQDGANWIYISGQSGTGKTHLGTATCIYYLRKGKTTRYTTHQQLMIEFRSNANDEREYYNKLMEYGKAEVLYIDDFFKYEPTESDLRHTFELINLRLLQNNITIITSEKSLLEIMDYDEALGSRIKQKCGEFCINIAKKPERNYRLKG